MMFFKGPAPAIRSLEGAAEAVHSPRAFYAMGQIKDYFPLILYLAFPLL